MFLPITSCGRVAEQALRGRAERLHHAVLVDHDHRVGNGVQNRPEVRLAREHVVCAGARPQPGALQMLAEQGYADPNHRKGGSVGDDRKAQRWETACQRSSEHRG